VNLTDKRFQNCGKTRLCFFEKHADFGEMLNLKKRNFRWQAQGNVTFNAENTVLLTPRTEVYGYQFQPHLAWLVV